MRRPTRSKDLPRNLKLTEQERADLVAFLESLSSDTPPQPSTEAWVGSGQPAPPPPPKDTTVVSQANKLFAPAHVRLGVGQTLTVLNDDTRTHNVRIFDPRLDFNSGAQEPKERVTIRFPVARHLRGLLRHPPVDAPDHRRSVKRASAPPTRRPSPAVRAGGATGTRVPHRQPWGRYHPAREAPVARLPGNPVGLPETLLGSLGCLAAPA